jgi:hypothetical protein
LESRSWEGFFYSAGLVEPLNLTPPVTGAGLSSLIFYEECFLMSLCFSGKFFWS